MTRPKTAYLTIQVTRRLAPQISGGQTMLPPLCICAESLKRRKLGLFWKFSARPQDPQQSGPVTISDD